MRCPIPETALWAKLAPKVRPVRWHSLADHSIDVAACFEALLDIALIQTRLSSLAGKPSFPQTWKPRLVALAFLHDFGKVNRKFQAEEGGHIKEAAFVAFSLARRRAAGLDALDTFGPPSEFLLAVVLGHHGEPPADPGQHDLAWKAGSDRDPVADIGLLIEGAKAIWPAAFASDGPPLPEPESRFWHTILGLLQVADWLGSDNALDAFPFSDEGDGPRLDFARQRARELLEQIGLHPALLRRSPSAVDFDDLFDFTPSDIQRSAAEMPGPVIVLEAETGSGKTEAALWRFASLFRAGKVDGLYFALPTRVAATQMHARVQACADRMFPGAAIEVVRALPGDVSAGLARARPLPEFGVQWSDDPDEATRRARWAAERPKRFLAASIAVGTIDQALLAAVRTKHAQMRSACLSRSLLVVDEVHASDKFMERLLLNLLDQHRAAGGEALLLSATLGGAARTRLLLGGGARAEKCVPDRDEAVSVPYPALSSLIRGKVHTEAKAGLGRRKQVSVEPSRAIGDPHAVALEALEAAERGAKVLVVRNTVRDAIATARMLHGIAPDHPALFRLDGVPTLHHGRFARSDRVRLDLAAEVAIGKVRSETPLVLIGTQTLEQSLDIDADYLISDLAPIDVLLQRLGRLHRHDRERPSAFVTSRATVLIPNGFDAALTAIERGRSGPHGFGKVYGDLVALAATERLIGAGAEWDIPAMNRELVEAGTHPAALDALAARIVEETGDHRWHAAQVGVLGRLIAETQTADAIKIDWRQPVSDFRTADIPATTRLGLGDVEFEFPRVSGPFPGSPPVERLVIPAWMFDNTRTEAQPVDIVPEPNSFSFRLSERVFSYTRYGLERT